MAKIASVFGWLFLAIFSLILGTYSVSEFGMIALLPVIILWVFMGTQVALRLAGTHKYSSYRLF